MGHSAHPGAARAGGRNSSRGPSKGRGSGGHSKGSTHAGSKGNQHNERE